MTTGVIAGSFDVLHPGYIRMFIDARPHCERLIVLLHSDPSIERPQKCRPILSTLERASALLSLRYVDEVVTYTLERELYDLLVQLRPDVRFLGEDYRDRTGYTGADLGIPIHYLTRDHGWSTSKLKSMIAESLSSQEAII